MRPLLAVQDLLIRSARQVLLQDVSFALHEGEMLTVLGESGAGKSVMAQAIMGTLPPELAASGDVNVDGHTSAAGDASARRSLWGRVVTLLPQEPWVALDSTMRVGNQLAEVYQLVRRDARYRPHAHELARTTLATLGLGAASRLYPWQLSGGMAQRAAFAIALAGGARVLLIDEPTKGLDATRRAQLVQAMKQVQAAGGAVVTITHDLRVARSLGGQLVVLRDGFVVEQGDCWTVLARPQHEFTRRLIAANPASWPAREASTVGATVLQARGLAKSFGRQCLFDAVDLELRRGQRLVIQGPSGVGKTTLGNILLGLVRADAGTITRSDGLKSTDLQKLYQDPVSTFAPRISLIAALRDLARRHRIDWPDVQQAAGQLRLPAELLERRPHQVSGGELQRVSLLRVLLLKPALIFADEPTSRLDPILQQDMMALLLDESDRYGMALVLVTHDDDIARHAATQILTLDAMSGPTQSETSTIAAAPSTVLSVTTPDGDALRQLMLAGSGLLSIPLLHTTLN